MDTLTMMTELLERLGETRLATTISASPSLFPWLEVVHVMAICLVLGTIVLVDLRLVGLASVRLKVSRLTGQLLPITWIAFALAVTSGALLFLSQPAAYFANVAFRMKMIMLLAAGLNMAVFHLVTQRDMHLWDDSAALPRAAQLAGGLSISIWIIITGAGRWIGFV